MSQPLEAVTHEPCERCGLEPGAMCAGYPPPEDIATLLEECPPAFISALAQALRDHRSGKVCEGLVIELDSSTNGAQEWRIARTMKERLRLRKRA